MTDILALSFSRYSETHTEAQSLSDMDDFAAVHLVEKAPHTAYRASDADQTPVAQESSSTSSIAARAARASFIQLNPDSTWTNQTFSSNLCAAMDATTSQVSVSSGTLSLLFLIPDCFFNYGSLKYLSMDNVLLEGNATFPDPLDRLATAMKTSGIISIVFANSFFQPYNTWSASYTAPDWTQFFASYPAIASLIMQNCSLSGSLPARLPTTLTRINLNQNSLTGSIPSTIFENYAVTTLTGVTYEFSNNQLSGSIPSGLLTSTATSTIDLNLNNNNLTGTIPRDLFAFTKASTITRITVNLGSNSFTDSLPSDLWGFPAATTNSLKTLSLTFTSNTGLTGTIPSKWLTQYSFPSITGMTFG